MTRRRLLSIGALVALPASLLLAGCSFSASASASLTVPASDIEDTAAGALEEQVGTRPDLDCGDERVKLIDDTTIDCTLTDPSSGSEYDAVVTISDVEGTKYHVAVQVADTAN